MLQQTQDKVAAGVQIKPEAQAAWRKLRVAIIDDAMHPPKLDRLRDAEAKAIGALLTTDPQITGELLAHGCSEAASADERLLLIARSQEPFEAIARLAEASADVQRMIDEHRSFLRLQSALEDEVGNCLSAIHSLNCQISATVTSFCWTITWRAAQRTARWPSRSPT